MESNTVNILIKTNSISPEVETWRKNLEFERKRVGYDSEVQDFSNIREIHLFIIRHQEEEAFFDLLKAAADLRRKISESENSNSNVTLCIIRCYSTEQDHYEPMHHLINRYCELFTELLSFDTYYHEFKHNSSPHYSWYGKCYPLMRVFGRRQDNTKKSKEGTKYKMEYTNSLFHVSKSGPPHMMVVLVECFPTIGDVECQVICGDLVFNSTIGITAKLSTEHSVTGSEPSGIFKLEECKSNGNGLPVKPICFAMQVVVVNDTHSKVKTQLNDPEASLSVSCKHKTWQVTSAVILHTSTYRKKLANIKYADSRLKLGHHSSVDTMSATSLEDLLGTNYPSFYEYPTTDEMDITTPRHHELIFSDDYWSMILRVEAFFNAILNNIDDSTAINKIITMARQELGLLQQHISTGHESHYKETK